MKSIFMKHLLYIFYAVLISTIGCNNAYGQDEWVIRLKNGQEVTCDIDSIHEMFARKKAPVNPYCDLPVKFVMENVYQVPTLYIACNSLGEFCSITSNGTQFVFKGSKESSYVNTTAINDYSGFCLGLSGLIVGLPNVPESRQTQNVVVCYDLACPNCYEDYNVSKPLTLQNGIATCAKCSRSYDLNNGGIVSDGNPGKYLFRYRVTYTNNTLNVGKTENQEVKDITCAQAVELTNALADGGTSTETYTITGYITEVVGFVSMNQQTFWIADTKGGGRIFEAYWANLPEGTTEFVKGSKVKITGKLTKYVKNNVVTPEMKSANVVVLEVGDGSDDSGNTGGDSGYGINLSYVLGTNAYDNHVATINDVADCKVLKIATSKTSGDFTLTVPAGKHSFYAVTWVGTGTADVQLKNGEDVVQTITVKENAGATGTSPFTLIVTEEDKYEFEVASDCTLTVTSDKRILFFGIK